MKVPEHKRPASTEMLEHEEGNPDYHLIFSLGPEYYAATLGSIPVRTNNINKTFLICICIL